MCPTEGCVMLPFVQGIPKWGGQEDLPVGGVGTLSLTLHVLLEYGSTPSSLWPQNWKEEVGMSSPGVAQPQRPLNIGL